MVLTKRELVAALHNEVRILLHLAGKVDRTQLHYRPTKQRSTIELLRYLTVMGPAFVQAAKAGSFDRLGENGEIERTFSGRAAPKDRLLTLHDMDTRRGRL